MRVSAPLTRGTCRIRRFDEHGLAGCSGASMSGFSNRRILSSRSFLRFCLIPLKRTKLKSSSQIFSSTGRLPRRRSELFELVTPSMANRLVSPQEEQDIFYLKPSIWSAIYRRDLLLENSIDFLETPGASYQDAGFNFKVWASAVRVVYLHEAYLHYRQDNESSSVNSRGKIYCVCDEYREMERYLEERPAKKACLEPVLIKMRYDSYMWNYERLAPEFQLEFLECMSREFNADKERGALDFDYFEPWKIIDLNTIIDSPELYHAQRTSCGNQGRFGQDTTLLSSRRSPAACENRSQQAWSLACVRKLVLRISYAVYFRHCSRVQRGRSISAFAFRLSASNLCAISRSYALMTALPTLRASCWICSPPSTSVYALLWRRRMAGFRRRETQVSKQRRGDWTLCSSIRTTCSRERHARKCLRFLSKPRPTSSLPVLNAIPNRLAILGS